jgi:hypothetical protein
MGSLPSRVRRVSCCWWLGFQRRHCWLITHALDLHASTLLPQRPRDQKGPSDAVLFLVPSYAGFLVEALVILPLESGSGVIAGPKLARTGPHCPSLSAPRAFYR